MAINRKSLKNGITSKDFNYRGGFYSLKSDIINSSDCFIFNSYKALRGLQDLKSNNYSNLFLTKRAKTEDWLDYDFRDDEKRSMVTTISFFNSEAKNDTNPGVFLYFNKNYEFWDINVASVPYTLTQNRAEEAYFNYIFQIDFLDDHQCRISHNFGDLVFYLSVGEDNSITFVKNGDDIIDTSTFFYNMEENNIVLYKKVRTYVYVFKQVLDSNNKPIKDSDGNPVMEIDEKKSYWKNSLYVLRCRQEESGEYILFLSETLEDDDDGILYLNGEDFNFNLNLNSSWVGYDRSGAIDVINNEKSDFNIKNQFLMHHQYNANGEINFIPLKNSLTYKNELVRGDNLTNIHPNNPEANFRNYVSISSGINQEKGNDNIILNFTFNDQTFSIKDGEDLAFYVPTKSENDNMEPLWPYKQININDTKFVKNGSFSSDVPYFADKIRCSRGTSLNISEKEKEDISRGTYLCTWLYKHDENSDPIWLDRYYYPDYITKTNAYYGKEKFVETVDNIFNNLYHLQTDELFNNLPAEKVEEIKKEMKKSMFENAYFDKRSDFILQPGKNYIYSRLSSDMVSNVLESIKTNRISQALNKSNVLVDLKERMKLDGKNYLKIPYENFTNTNEINFNFDIHLDAKKRLGLQLIGTDYKHGFNIQNRKDIAPFHYIADENSLYMLNNSFELKRKINLYELYGDNIIRYVLGDIFDDIVVFTSSFLYIITYDLALKAKISYNDIMGVDEVLVSDKDNINNIETVLNYPYINYEKTINRNVVYDGTDNIPHSMDLEFSYTREITPYSSNTLEILLETDGDNDSFEIENRIVQVFTSHNPLVYKNNLYIPYYNKILKLIFVPDTQKDSFTIDDRNEYPCKIRTLDTDEYILNYFTSNYESTDDSLTQETISDTVNDFIEIENIIKSIYISENGKIYGFNYDKIALSGDRDTIYGLYAKESYLNSGGWWWLFNQSLSKLESDQTTSKYAEFASMNSIDFIRFNENNYMAMVRNFSTRDITGADEGNRRLEIYDKTKERIFSYDLTMYQECLCLDAYNMIDEYGEEHSVFMCLVRDDDMIYRISYHVHEERIVIDELSEDFPTTLNRCFTETTNSNSILRYADRNALYFNLFLPSTFIYDYIATIKWNLQDIQTGWYNINVAISLDEAKFEVKINDIIYKTISFEDDEYSWFLPYVNSNAAVFASSIYIAKTPKQYGHTMGAILNYENDPYICTNSKIENVSIFTKNLRYNEYQAMRLEDKKINPLTLTIPCGQRNAIDEIVRYFKYNATSSISNSVKINISGLRNIIDDNNINLFKKELLTILNERKDAIVKIKDIDFVD